MSKKHLYYYNWQIQASVFGVVMDDVIENISDDLYFLSCRGSLLPCWSNIEADKRLCEVCRYNQKAAFSHGDLQKVKHLYVDDYTDWNEVDELFPKLNLQYQTIQDIRKLQFNGVSIGYGALSSYISRTRNRDPIIDEEFIAYFNRLLKVQIFIKLALDRVIEEIKPELISIFNGRVHDTRPVFETAVNSGIPLRGVETVVKGILDYQRRIFLDALPHSIPFQTQYINQVWETSELAEEKKISLASEFYERRRKGILTRDIRAYTKNQTIGKIPNQWDASKHNVVIFNSSEDEFAAIGKEWEDLALFDDQFEGIRFILEGIQDTDIHFYLRVHPNLKNVSYGYHVKLYELDKNYSNVTVIPASADVSTYALMDSADKVVVFGSSTGMEAVYAGKPVILLGGTFYYHLGATYNPSTRKQTIELIKDKHLSPKSKIGAYKFAFYLMFIDGYSKPIKFNAKNLILLGRTVGYTFPHLKLLNSSRLHKLGLLALRLKHKLSFKSKELTIPKKGN